MSASLLFYFFAVLAAGSAIGVLRVQNVLHAALWLVACVLSVAVIFILLNASFLGVTQVLVYAAGILILIIFGIMITVRTSGEPPRAGHQHATSGYLLCGSLFAFLLYGIFHATSGQSNFQTARSSVQSLGIEMATTYLAPFELTGLLLLVSLMGASLIASFNRKV